MVEFVTNLLKDYIPAQLVVFVLSMMPISELRGGLLAAALLGVPASNALVISIIGNMIPIPFIVLFIRKILSLLKKTKLFHRLAVKYETKADRKGAELIQKYPKQIQIGLFLFVAIPLPMTGAWTGSLIAAFLNLPLRKSLPPLMGGVLGAAAIVFTITYIIPYFVTSAL